MTSFSRRFVVVSIALFVFAGASAVTAAQQAAAISGVVSDQTGAVVPGATVELVSGAAGTRATVTDTQGRYRFEGLSSGEHAVRVTATGFLPAERRVSVAPSGSGVADFQLALATIAEAVQVVAASGYARPASELPVSATVVSREQALASPERSVDALLRNVASVQLQGYDADAIHPMVPSLAMRGVGIGDSADRGLVLVDGLPINGGFFGHINWNRAPKRTVERVEVVRGASSSLFGSYAMGGVVDVITRVPSSRETAIDLQYGENNRVQGNVFHGGVAGTRSSYSFNANVTDSDGFYTVPDDDRRPIDTRLASNLVNLQGRLDAALNNRLRLFFKAAYDDQSRRGPYQNASTDTDLFDIAGGIGLSFENAGTLNIRGMYATENFDVRNVRIVDDTTTFVANPHESDSNNLLLSGVWARPMSGVVSHLSAGADLRRIDGSDDQQVFNTPGQLNAHIIGEGVQTSLGAFGQVSLRPTSNTEILAGVRLRPATRKLGIVSVRSEKEVATPFVVICPSELSKRSTDVDHRFQAAAADSNNVRELNSELAIHETDFSAAKEVLDAVVKVVDLSGQRTLMDLDTAIAAEEALLDEVRIRETPEGRTFEAAIQRCQRRRGETLEHRAAPSIRSPAVCAEEVPAPNKSPVKARKRGIERDDMTPSSFS